jgi:ADP-ribose pyrophosphatase
VRAKNSVDFPITVNGIFGFSDRSHKNHHSMSDDYLQRLPNWMQAAGDANSGEIEVLAGGGDLQFGIRYEDPYILVIRDRVRFPDGREGGYVRLVNKGELDGSPGAVIVPVWSGCVVFIRIFRHATRSWEWELPRGFHEAGLSESSNAEKETKEELGVGVVSVRNLGGFNANTGLLTGTIGAYAAELAANPLDSGTPELAESIRDVRLVPLASLEEFIREAPVRCGISLAALLLYLNRAKRTP